MARRNSVRTGRKIATRASRSLRSGGTSRATKQLAGSALSNRKRNSRR